MASTLQSRIDAVAAELEQLAGEVAQDEAARKQLLTALRRATGQVELPLEVVWRILMSPHAPAAINVLVRTGVLHEIVRAERPCTAAELATKLAVDRSLIVRMMRPPIALGIFKETDRETYAATPIAQLLATPALTAGNKFLFDCATRPLAHMPDYLESIGWKDIHASPGVFEATVGDGDAMYPYLNKRPKMLESFNTYMTATLGTRKSWFDKFDAHAILLNGASKNPDDVLLVDVAGGQGHDVAAFRKAFPDQPGQLVLQDVPATIDNIADLDAAIVRQKHDFFTEQPVRGARCYYFRNIFHNWPTEDCVKILKQIAAAMKPGYSKLVIFEWILPPRDVPLFPALLDINFIAMLNGRERSESDWQELLGAAGLKARKFWTIDPEQEGVIEAVLQDD